MKNKITLHTATNRLFPATSVEIESEKVLCNDIVLPFIETHPRKVRLWLIGHEYGAIGAVWADCEQDALDELVDKGLGDSLLVDEKDLASMSEEEREELAYLGNAGEECDLTNVWMAAVQWDKVRDFEILMAFAEAKGSNVDNLGEL